jgi:hypothetical protein
MIVSGPLDAMKFKVYEGIRIWNSETHMIFLFRLANGKWYCFPDTEIACSLVSIQWNNSRDNALFHL